MKNGETLADIVKKEDPHLYIDGSNDKSFKLSIDTCIGAVEKELDLDGAIALQKQLDIWIKRCHYVYEDCGNYVVIKNGHRTLVKIDKNVFDYEGRCRKILMELKGHE